VIWSSVIIKFDNGSSFHLRPLSFGNNGIETQQTITSLLVEQLKRLAICGHY